jgi:hypothetical protein
VADPVSIDDWKRLAQTHQRSAEVLCRTRHTTQQAVFHAAMSMECLLKAYIMRVERLNAFPDKSSRPGLYTHDLRVLSGIAGIVVTPQDSRAAEWSVVMQWDRNQGYDPDPMPRRVAKSYVEAAFGHNGVARWLKSQIQ